MYPHDTRPPLARRVLSGARFGIDRVDDAMIVLLAARRRLVSAAAPAKNAMDAPVHDREREAQVHDRAERMAARLRIPAASAHRLVDTLIGDACQQQSSRVSADSASTHAQGEGGASRATRLLRLLPPPRRWRAPLALVPSVVLDGAAERVLSKALVQSLQGDWLQVVERRRIGIEVTDLGLSWVLEVDAGRVRRSRGAAEAMVRGTATDLMLLASRLEDADTLFFQRRLMLTGDVELGLTVRNLLDRLPWESLPLGLRIVLHRTARGMRAARAVHA